MQFVASSHAVSQLLASLRSLASRAEAGEIATRACPVPPRPLEPMSTGRHGAGYCEPEKTPSTRAQPCTRAFPPVTVNRIRHESAVFGKTAWRPVASMDTIREDALIGLAHPAFCDQLTADAKAAYPI